MDAPGNTTGFNVPASPGGVAQFTVIPVAPGPGLSLTALGNLNPPGHVLPTDHVYFYGGDLSSGSPFGTTTRDVYMPATARLAWILWSGVEAKPMFKVTEQFYFYFGHLVPTIPMNVGDVIRAGTKIGTTTPGGTLDLGAFDYSVTRTGFLNRARYPEQTLYVVSPWKYFTADLQQQLYAKVYRAPTAPDRDGRVDFGVAGRLVGDWFLEGTPADSSAGPYGWSRTIAFVYDYYDPSQVRISIGGTIGPAGVWAIAAAAPRPADVTPASGMVSYLLYSPFDPGFPPTGLLLVQMLTDASIKVELFPGVTATGRTFDANAVTFVR